MNESDGVSLDKLLVLPDLVRCLFRVSPLHFDIVIDLNVKATFSHVRFTLNISNVSFEKECKLKGKVNISTTITLVVPYINLHHTKKYIK